MDPYEALREYDAEYRREELELAQIQDEIKGENEVKNVDSVKSKPMGSLPIISILFNWSFSMLAVRLEINSEEKGCVALEAESLQLDRDIENAELRRAAIAAKMER